VQAGVFLATETGCVDGRDSADAYELLRSDWGHTTFDEGPYRVEDGEGGTCTWILAMTNKMATRNYTQPLHVTGQRLVEVLRAYRPIALAMRPPGTDAAPVLCITAAQLQARIGAMLSATTGNVGATGYDDNQVSQRRSAWLRRVNKGAAVQLTARCKARHVLRSFRDGAPEARREADRLRDSTCAGYGTGNVREATGGV